MNLPHTKQFAAKEQPDSSRPFRIYNTSTKRNVPHRCYATARNALDGALLLLKWEPSLVCVEVWDIRTSDWIGVFKRTSTAIQFTHVKGV